MSERRLGYADLLTMIKSEVRYWEFEAQRLYVSAGSMPHYEETVARMANYAAGALMFWRALADLTAAPLTGEERKQQTAIRERDEAQLKAVVHGYGPPEKPGKRRKPRK